MMLEFDTVTVKLQKSRRTGDLANGHAECDHCGREWDIEILPFLDFDEILEMIEENCADHVADDREFAEVANVA